MKGLKKIVLATAIAAAPFATQAGMKALDDTAMGNVTGQAGVTIELETRVEIGKFTYTDEGSFSVSGIELGGSTVGTDVAGNELLDELAIDIDVNANGDAVIHVGSLDTQTVPDSDAIAGLIQQEAAQYFVDNSINPDTATDEQKAAAQAAGTQAVATQLQTDNSYPEKEATNPIDWGMTADSMELTSQDGSKSTTLLSGLKGHGNLSQLDISVRNNDSTRLGSQLEANGVLELDVGFNVVDMEFDVEFLGVGIKGLSIMGADSDVKKGFYMGVLGLDEAEADDLLSTTSFATASLDVYKGDGLGSSTVEDVLRIDVSTVAMDLSIDAIEIGTLADGSAASIGSIAMDNLVISDTKLAVYGH